MNRLRWFFLMISVSLISSIALAQNPLVQTKPAEDPLQEIVKKCRSLNHMSMIRCIDLENRKEGALKPQQPAEMANPTLPDDNSISKGEKVYQQHCLSCHGIEGKGDGGMSVYFGKPVSDLTTAQVQGKTDEQLYQVISGADYPMPGFEHYLSKEDVWDSINYLRTLTALQDDKT